MFKGKNTLHRFGLLTLLTISYETAKVEKRWGKFVDKILALQCDAVAKVVRFHLLTVIRSNKYTTSVQIYVFAGTMYKYGMECAHIQYIYYTIV